MKEIYSFFIAEARLLPRHKDELVAKRGFSEESIERFKFKSGGPHIAALEGELGKRFKEADLVASGIFIQDGRGARINPQLTHEESLVNGKKISNILIPYLDTDSGVYFVRPHKMGLKGLPIEVYQNLNLTDNPQEIILTEGEFKAAAGMQFGMPTIAIPGIGTFSETHFPKLLALLNQFKVRRIVIMFDSETKDNPEIPERFKGDPSKRHDTEFYAYYMAVKLEREGKDVAIAVLPDGWKVEGKIDIDGALASGRSSSEMKKIVFDAKPRNEFLSELSTEAKTVVLRKCAQKRHRSNIRREFNRYIATRKRGKSEWDETISNFIIHIIATHDTIEGVKREVEFINEFGRRSSSFTMDPADMAGPDSFRVFCMSRGDFVWRGGLDDLMTIWESEFLMMDEGRHIVESDHLGWIEKEGLWLFGNVAIDNDGKEMTPDSNGIFWRDKKGIKPVPLMVSSGKNIISEGIPHIYKGQFDNCSNEIKTRLADTIGSNETGVIMGWISAVAFMEEIFKAYGSFPFLFVTGRFESGKSTIAKWVMSFFGIETEGMAISQTTPVAIQRSLGYYSCLPVFLDEYRNTKDVAMKNGFLRNVYNRQSAGKGLKADFGLREARVRGTLILSGEETPKDGALLTRSITVFISRQKRTRNHFSWFMANKGRFSAHFMGLLKRKKDLVKTFLETAEEWKHFFTDREINDRVAINYATVIAGYAAVFGTEDLTFANWLITETKQIQSEQHEEQAVSVFLDDLMAMKTRKLINNDYWMVDGNFIFIYFHGLHQIWAQEYRKSRGEEAFKEGSIRSYLREELGFERLNEPKRINGQIKKCVVFRLKEAPIEILTLVDCAPEPAEMLL